MEQITSRIENDALFLMLNGRIDSTNASEVQEKLDELIEEKGGLPVTLDAEKLAYISSAGLRVVLRLKKKKKELSIINVSPEVYDIFDMTGFTSLLNVRRAFRQLSVEGCKEIARGAKGAVYRYDADTVVKKYFNPDSLPAILNERELAKKAFILGIPTAISYDVVKIGEGYGSVFELLDAVTYSRCIVDHADDFQEYTDRFAGLLRQIHETEVDPEEMPDNRELVRKWLKDTENVLPEADHQALTAMVEALPDVNTMIHGDYHTNNLMLQNGETLLIDMDTLSHGHPILDLANIYFAYKGFAAIDPENVSAFLGMPAALAEKVWDDFLAAYLNTEDEEEIEKVRNKIELLGNLRVLRHIARRDDGSEATAKKIASCKEKIHALLEKVDDLNF